MPVRSPIQRGKDRTRANRALPTCILAVAAALCHPFAFSSPEVAASGDADAAIRTAAAHGMDHAGDRGPSLYVCPMHAAETDSRPGPCQICGMTLVAKDTPSGDGHHQTHKHPAPNTAVEHSAALADDEKRQGLMPLAPTDRPALFWDSDTSLQSAARLPADHGHREPAYVCPMHPDAVSDAPGSCPQCGMFLVEKAAGDRGEGSDAAAEAPIAETLQGEPGAGAAANHGVDTAREHAGRHLDPTYVCPMHPQIVQNEPSSCPICGMDLVRKDNVAPASGQPQVFLSPAVIQNMGVRTAKAERRSLRRDLRSQGIVKADDDRIRNVHPRVGGWIETLYLLTEGDRIERKDVLADFYSPWINQVQLDFITALEEYDLVAFDPSRKTELGAKVDALRNALRLLHVSSMDVMRVENSRKVQSTIQLMAPNSGLVTKLNVREGSYVEPFEPLFTIVDLSEVWVMVDIYEHQAPWVRKGNRVEIAAPAIPGRTWSGMIDFIYPEVDPKTRTLRARIEVANPDEALLLNMFVQVDLSVGASKHDVLTIPREALILTGEREIVVKALDKGHFQPVEVTTGVWGDNQAEIVSGLTEGDEVVVSGQFLIDSESNLQASFRRMSE